MKIGYNTNGLNCHRWGEALRLLADTGYESVAITVDHHCLDPYSDRLPAETAEMRSLLAELSLSNVIETGARFLLDPSRKHEPTLMNPDPAARAIRVEFLLKCIDLAVELNSSAVSFWSGILREPLSREAGMDRLCEGLQPVCDYAGQRQIRLAFEPEPGMFIETMTQYRELAGRLNCPQFGLTIDIGHLHCLGETPITDFLQAYQERLWNIHIEDMRTGIHDHLRFGEGEIDFPPILRTLQEIQYQGGVHVELSRHSHMAPEVVRESYHFLKGILQELP